MNLRILSRNVYDDPAQNSESNPFVFPRAVKDCPRPLQAPLDVWVIKLGPARPCMTLR